MDNFFIGQIMMFAGGFIPKGFLACEGQILSIAQNQALYSLLGTTYGGDGRSTFALPDLRGRIAVNAGQLNNANYTLGTSFGSEKTQLTVDQLPQHVHSQQSPITVNVKVNSSDDEDSNSPVGKFLRATPGEMNFSKTANAVMGPTPATITMGTGGSGQAYSNLQPTLTMIFCIATTGLYPSRP
jgi:microcystin-dependent protein